MTDVHAGSSRTNTMTGSVVPIAVPATPKTTMIFSDSGSSMLKKTERLRLKPYDDQTGKETSTYVVGATIGYGHLISKSDWKTYSTGITQTQADALFTADLQPFVDEVNSDLTVGVTQNQFDALVILCYNIGMSGFASSSVLKLVNNPAAATAYKSLDDAWKAFNKSQGVVNQGLNHRREAELRIYKNGDYSGW